MFDAVAHRNSLRPMLVLCGLLTLVVSVAGAASIPAWLDDAITSWNAENPATQITFLDIKDSYVWYMVPRTQEIGHKEVRERIYGIAQGHGYKFTTDEELVTTGKPPSPVAPYKPKKCWTRSFVLNVGANNTGQQRMLTSMVCEDVDQWYAGFRILQ